MKPGLQEKAAVGAAVVDPAEVEVAVAAAATAVEVAADGPAVAVGAAEAAEAETVTAATAVEAEAAGSFGIRSEILVRWPGNLLREVPRFLLDIYQ
jgi:hypothetical protein